MILFCFKSRNKQILFYTPDPFVQIKFALSINIQKMAAKY